MSALIPARPRVYRPRVNVSWSPGKTSVVNVAAAFVLFLTLCFIASSPSKDVRHLALSAAPASGAPELSASSVGASSRLGYITVLGEARNVSQSSLTNVEAVVELLDRRGAIVGMESALIGVKQLGPSESTP